MTATALRQSSPPTHPCKIADLVGAHPLFPTRLPAIQPLYRPCLSKPKAPNLSLPLILSLFLAAADPPPSPKKRFNSITWAVDVDAVFALGPATIDPRTGEILHSGIVFTNGWIDSWSAGFEIYGDSPESSGSRSAFLLVVAVWRWMPLSFVAVFCCWCGSCFVVYVVFVVVAVSIDCVIVSVGADDDGWHVVLSRGNSEGDDYGVILL